MFGACTSLIIALIICLYGINKFSVLINYEDTRINEFTVRNGLSEEIIEQDQLQFNIAFTVFEYSYNETLGGYNEATNENHEQYLDYQVSLWTLKGGEYLDEERLSIHKCNESEKGILSENKDYIDTNDYEKWWSKFYCLDNPEKLNLRSDINEEGIRSLFIDPYYC